MKILIALDESDASHDAARYAADLLGLQPQAIGSDHEVLVLRVHDSVNAPVRQRVSRAPCAAPGSGRPVAYVRGNESTKGSPTGLIVEVAG